MSRTVTTIHNKRRKETNATEVSTVLITYHVPYLIIFSVCSFLFALSLLVTIGCLIDDEMCNDPKKSTMSEIVDQPEIYQWFAVLSTLNVIVLLFAMFHYIDPIRVTKGMQILSYRISVAVLNLQTIASVFFLVVILLPITLHPETHVVVVQIAFGFILLVHVAIWTRSFLCESGEYHTLVLGIQLVHLTSIFALALAYLYSENGWVEIAFILMTILYYIYLAYEYWNVSVTCMVNNDAASVTNSSQNRRSRRAYEQPRPTKRPSLTRLRV